MPITFINNSLLNSVLKFLLAASFFWSCNFLSTGNYIYSTKVKNPGLIISPNQETPDDWIIERNKNFVISKSDFNKPFLSSTHSGEILFSQTLTLDSGDYFLKAKYDVNVSKGAFFIKVDNEEGINIYSSESTCYRTVFTIPIKSKKKVNLQFGFVDESIGEALIDTISIEKIVYKTANDIKSENIHLLNTTLNLSPQNPSGLDQLVEKIAESINIAFLKNKNPKRILLDSLFSSKTFESKHTRHLSKYIKEDDISIENAYCQKSSTSIDELLRLFQIPTRQLHWQKDCSGFHQFIEYYNKYKDRWEIIDPYYGVRYVDQRGNYLNFEGVEKLVRNNNFTSKNIKQIEIGRLYYSESEILAGWTKADLAVYVLNK